MCSETSEAVGTIWEHAQKEFQKFLKIRITLMSTHASKLEFRFYSVEVIYPPGLEEMIGAFKFCATARLFLQVGTLHVCLRDHSWIIFRLMLTQKKSSRH